MLSLCARRRRIAEVSELVATRKDQDSLRARYKALRKKLLSFNPVFRRSRHERALARLSPQHDNQRKTK